MLFDKQLTCHDNPASMRLVRCTTLWFEELIRAQGDVVSLLTSPTDIQAMPGTFIGNFEDELCC
jgi:hypothetical protein